MTVNMYVGRILARQRLEETARDADLAALRRPPRTPARRRFPRVRWRRPRLVTSDAGRGPRAAAW